MSTLKELILKRPTHKTELLNLLLEFAANENPEVRSNAMRMIKVLHERQDMEVFIEVGLFVTLGNSLFLNGTIPRITEVPCSRQCLTWLRKRLIKIFMILLCRYAPK
jgi:hypothetical protein